MLDNGLTIITQNNNHYIDSREVAEIVEKRHDHLMRDIINFIQIIKNSTDPNFGVSDFFLENTYKDRTGRTLPCYLISKMGCEALVHKMTGEKGILFTAMYVYKFNQMEQKERETSLSRPKISQLGDCNAAANMIVGVLKSANAPADRIAVAVKHLYGLSGIPISLDGIVAKCTYSACDIARICGILTLNENPHFLAISAIISMLDIGDEHKTYIPYFYGNKVRISVQYDDYVIEKVQRWLVLHDYPCEIFCNGKIYCIMYEDEDDDIDDI